MRWHTKRWPYVDCRRIVRVFLWKPHKVGCEWRWLEPALLMQRWCGKWEDVGWTKEPISEREWVKISRGEWHSFHPGEVIFHKIQQEVSNLPFDKWLKQHHEGRL